MDNAIIIKIIVWLLVMFLMGFLFYLLVWLKELAIEAEWKVREIGKRVINGQLTYWKDGSMSDNVFKILVVLLIMLSIGLSYNKSESKVGRYVPQGDRVLDTTTGSLYILDSKQTDHLSWSQVSYPITSSEESSKK